MRVLILGGDGYLGWPTAMYFARRGHVVGVVDNMIKRQWEAQLGIRPLWPVASLLERARVWQELGNLPIEVFVGDLTHYRFVEDVLRSFRPDTIIHYGEQPSAPFSMMDVDRCVATQVNNVVGTLHVIWGMIRVCPEAHLIKLGTMGEYGTPNIDIEEGYLEVESHGRRDVLPFPKQPGSFYHLSKVHDSHNLLFAARTYDLRVTDLNQGVVYGTQTDETLLDPRLRTSVHYDHVFGTVLNRFCAEAVTGHPLTVYGAGRQTRGFLNIRDTLQCVMLAAEHPAQPGEFRVMNQFTEQFSILQLARMVQEATRALLGMEPEIRHLRNPRAEQEEHYYNAKHSKLIELGLVPHLLTQEVLQGMLADFAANADRIDVRAFEPTITWRPSVPAESGHRR